MSITRLSGKAVVAEWEQHRIFGIEGIVSLHNELLRQFKFCTTLHFDADKPCCIRVLVRADENAQALADEISAAIREHMPLAATPSAVKTRIVTAPEFGKDDDDIRGASATIELKTAEQYHKLLTLLLNTKLSGAMGNDPVLDELLEAVRDSAHVPEGWLP